MAYAILNVKHVLFDQEDSAHHINEEVSEKYQLSTLLGRIVTLNCSGSQN